MSASKDRLLWSAVPASVCADIEALVGGRVVRARTRVAVGGDRGIVGFATTLPVEGALELEDLFVEPRWMRRGIARHLLEDVLSSARRLGVCSVQVTAGPDALAFYTAVGFVPDGTAQTRFGPAGGGRRGQRDDPQVQDLGHLARGGIPSNGESLRAGRGDAVSD